MLEPTDAKWDEFHDAEIVDWKRIRSSIEHENTLTNHRLTWLLTSQGFLFASFALMFQASTQESVIAERRELYKIVLAGVALVGILVAVYLRLGLRAAQVQHDRLRDWWHRRPVANSNRHPPVCGVEFGRLTNVLSYHSFPFVFVIAWLFFLLLVLWEALLPHADVLGIVALLLASVVGVLIVGMIIGRRMSGPSRTPPPGP